MIIRSITYQLNDTSRGLLVSLLGVEQETLAGLRGPGNGMVSNIGDLLVLQVGRKLLSADGIGTEPEVCLGVDDVPLDLSAGRLFVHPSMHHSLTWGSWQG